jgi:ABC-2 type transport system ATP-binding protein
MIEALALTKNYGEKRAVDDLTFTVRPGIVTGFLGPNGSGKSTTMRLILGLDAPTTGDVKVNGRHYREHRAPLHEVGALLEARSVHTGRSAANHLLALAQTHGIPRSRVDQLIDLVGLHDVARKRAGQFSLGMGQRLGIATALLGDPQTLLLDEPVNGLDPEGIQWIRNLLRGLAAEGRTVFVSSHLMSEMALTADHLIVIGRGQLLADMTIKDFISHNSADFARVRTPDTEPQQREKLTAALTEAGGQVLPEQDGALRVTGLPLPRISDLAHSADVRLWELSPHQASLEEAYMRMTQGAVDYRSTVDQKAGLQQELPPGAMPPPQMPVPGQGQPGWYAPPPPQQGGQPFAMPQGQPSPYGGAPVASRPGPYGAPGAPTAPDAADANPYAQSAPQAPAQPPAAPAAAPDLTKPEDAR